MSPGHDPPLWVLLKSRVMSSAWGVPEASMGVVWTPVPARVAVSPRISSPPITPPSGPHSAQSPA